VKTQAKGNAVSISQRKTNRVIKELRNKITAFTKAKATNMGLYSLKKNINQEYGPVPDDDKIWTWLSVILILSIVGAGALLYWIYLFVKWLFYTL
jgi:hypothetical protein